MKILDYNNQIKIFSNVKFIILQTTKIKMRNSNIKFYYSRKLIESNNAHISITQIQPRNKKDETLVVGGNIKFDNY